MSIETIDYLTYIKEDEIDKFIDYLFLSDDISERSISVPIDGKNVLLKNNKNRLKEYLNDIKEIKKRLIGIGDLGGSVYIYVIKREEGKDKIYINVRISYHAPNTHFGSGDSIGYLCIDALSQEDNEKVYQIRKKKYPHKLRESGLKDKEDYKKTVEELGLPNSKYVDLGTEDYSEIIKTIKSFLKNNDLILYENLNYEDFSISCEIDYDDD